MLLNGLGLHGVFEDSARGLGFRGYGEYAFHDTNAYGRFNLTARPHRCFPEHQAHRGPNKNSANMRLRTSHINPHRTQQQGHPCNMRCLSRFGVSNTEQIGASRRRADSRLEFGFEGTLP